VKNAPSPSIQSARTSQIDVPGEEILKKTSPYNRSMPCAQKCCLYASWFEFGKFWGPLRHPGGSWELPGGVFQTVFGRLEVFWRDLNVLECLGAQRGTSWSVLGAFWAYLEAVLGDLERVLGASWRFWVLLEAPLECPKEVLERC